MKVKQLALVANPQVVVVTNTVLPAAGEGSKCSENAKALLCFSAIINHKLLITLKNVVSKQKLLLRILYHISINPSSIGQRVSQSCTFCDVRCLLARSISPYDSVKYMLLNCLCINWKTCGIGKTVRKS